MLLLGIDDIKDALVDELTLILDRERLAAWSSKHHPQGLGIVAGARSRAPLVLLSGDVGCGKNGPGLVRGDPLIVAKAIGHPSLAWRPPPTFVAAGLVGELSTPTSPKTFTQAKEAKADQIGHSILRDRSKPDDLATRRQLDAGSLRRPGRRQRADQADRRNSRRPRRQLMAVIMIWQPGRCPRLRSRFISLHCACIFIDPMTKPALAVFQRILEGFRCIRQPDARSW